MNNVNRQVESSTPSDQLQRRSDGQKFDDDVAGYRKKPTAGWGKMLSTVSVWEWLNDMQYSFKYGGALSCKV